MSGARATAIVLAAGEARRYRGTKLVAPLDGRPILQWVLDAIDVAGVTDVIVVLGAAGDQVSAAVTWRRERPVRNPDAASGLASSLRAGMAALGPDVDVVLIALGDQPLVRPDVIRALVARAATGPRPIVVPRYAADGSTNPVALRREAFGLVASATGDRGLGPLLRAEPAMVEELPVEGDNPDIDTIDDLERLRARATDSDGPGAALETLDAQTLPR